MQKPKIQHLQRQVPFAIACLFLEMADAEEMLQKTS